MIQVTVEKMLLYKMGFVVFLKGADVPLSLPIFIGAAEAQAIALWMNNVEIPRPMTHDLLKNILDCVECRVHRVEVTDMQEGTFFANIILDIDGEEVAVDSRPSDAIALALRTGVNIYVSRSVMEEAGKVFDDDGEEQDGLPEKSGTSHLEQLKENLETAVAEERYEDAAGIRDQIRELEHHTTQN